MNFFTGLFQLCRRKPTASLAIFTSKFPLLKRTERGPQQRGSGSYRAECCRVAGSSARIDCYGVLSKNTLYLRLFIEQYVEKRISKLIRIPSMKNWKDSDSLFSDQNSHNLSYWTARNFRSRSRIHDKTLRLPASLVCCCVVLMRIKGNKND